MPRPEILIPLSIARRDRALLKAELRGERRATLRLLKSLGWDESKHHRDHGKFSSGGGGGADTDASVPSAPSSPPTPVDHISAAVSEAVAGLDPHEASHVTLLAVKAATKAHAVLARLTPAMFRALDALGLVFDTPDDLRKFGWSPGTSGTATGDAMAAGDPVRAATGVPSHIAAAVAAKVLGAGLVWARQQLGMPPMVKKAEEAPDFAGLAAVLAEALGAVAAEIGVDAPDPAAVLAAVQTALPVVKAVAPDTDDPHASLYEAALAAVIAAREAGDDDAVSGLIAAYREHLDDPDTLAAALAGAGGDAAVMKAIGAVILKAGRWDSNKHPRDDHGRFVSRDAIADAKGDPAKEEALRDKVTDPEERAKLDNALAGTTDLGRTKRGQQKHDAGQRRAKRAADHARAGEIADRIGAGTATHEEMHELGDHLEGLTVDKLRALQSRIPTEGRTPRKADMVRALRESLERSAHAKRVGAGAAGVEQRPAADHARLALAGMQPNRYDVTTAGGEVVPAGKGYQRWEGGGKAVGYTAEQAAKVAAGVTPDHADRRIAEHEAATVADGLDDVQREYHATVADQLRGHKEKVFGGGKEAAPAGAVSQDAPGAGRRVEMPAEPYKAGDRLRPGQHPGDRAIVADDDGKEYVVTNFRHGWADVVPADMPLVRENKQRISISGNDADGDTRAMHYTGRTLDTKPSANAPAVEADEQPPTPTPAASSPAADGPPSMDAVRETVSHRAAEMAAAKDTLVKRQKAAKTRVENLGRQQGEVQAEIRHRASLGHAPESYAHLTDAYAKNAREIDAASNRYAEISDQLAAMPTNATEAAWSQVAGELAEKHPDHYTVGKKLSPDGSREYDVPVAAKPAAPTPADIEDANRQMRDMERERQVREDDDAEYENRKANWDDWEDKRDRMEAWAADRPDSLAARGAAAAARGRMAPPDRGGSVGTVAAPPAESPDAELDRLSSLSRALTPAERTRRDQLRREWGERQLRARGATDVRPPAGGGKGPGVSDGENEGTGKADTLPATPKIDVDADAPGFGRHEVLASGTGKLHIELSGSNKGAPGYFGAENLDRIGGKNVRIGGQVYRATGAGEPFRGDRGKMSRRVYLEPVGVATGGDVPSATVASVGPPDHNATARSLGHEPDGDPIYPVRRLGFMSKENAGKAGAKIKIGDTFDRDGRRYVVTHTSPPRYANRETAEDLGSGKEAGWSVHYAAVPVRKPGATPSPPPPPPPVPVSPADVSDVEWGVKGEAYADADGHFYQSRDAAAHAAASHGPGAAVSQYGRFWVALRPKTPVAAPLPPASGPGGKPPAADPHLAPVLAAHAAAPEGSKLRDYLDAAVANASPAGHDASNPPKSLTPEQGRRLRKELASAHADAHAAGNLSPDDDAAFGRVMEGLGVKPLHEVGATVPFDPATMESAAGVSTGVPVRVQRRGWSGLYGDAKTGHENVGNNVRRAVVVPAAATVGKPTPPEKPVPAAKPARKPKADTAATSGYGQSGADHPLAGLDRESQWKRLGHLSGDSGEADRERLIASGPPKGLNLDTFNRDVHAAIAHADDQGLNAATAEAVYDRAGKRHGLTKAGFVRAMAALHNDEDNPDRMGRPGASQGTDLLAAQGRDPELMMPDAGGAASQFRLPRGADAAALKAEGERLYGGGGSAGPAGEPKGAARWPHIPPRPARPRRRGHFPTMTGTTSHTPASTITTPP